VDDTIFNQLKGMGPKPRMNAKEAAQLQAAVEFKASLAKKAEELGLEYQEQYVPPDEIDKAAVEKSMLETLKAMIPYTQAWYAAQSAEDEMDDYRRIEVDVAFNRNLVTMARTGRHEDAMEIMMADTNHDLHYFNFMKNKAIQEGKFKYDFKVTKGFKRNAKNKIQAAVQAPLPLMGEKGGADGSNAFSLNVSLGGQASDPCIWRCVIICTKVLSKQV
jgi:hypothetical protein